MDAPTMTPEKAAELRKEFPKSAIGKLPKGGAMLDYCGHAAVTDRLLAVDPTWSWEPFATNQLGLPALDEKGNLWIRLTVCGVTRIGVGDGATAKERIGDAIRNAAMRFGVALDLWSKEELEKGSLPEPTPRDWQAEIDACTTTDQLRHLWPQLPKDMQNAAQRRAGQLDHPQQTSEGDPQ